MQRQNHLCETTLPLLFAAAKHLANLLQPLSSPFSSCKYLSREKKRYFNHFKVGLVAAKKKKMLSVSAELCKSKVVVAKCTFANLQIYSL